MGARLGIVCGNGSQLVTVPLTVRVEVGLCRPSEAFHGQGADQVRLALIGRGNAPPRERLGSSSCLLAAARGCGPRTP